MSLLRFCVLSVFFIFFAITFTLFSSGSQNGLLKIKIIAQRGISFEAPENTTPAFQLAKDQGLDFIECDVRLSADNVPIIFHDNTTYRTTNLRKHIPIGSLTLGQIRNLDAGSWLSDKFKGVKIPTLKEALQFSRGNTGLILELKDLKEKNKILVMRLSRLLRDHPQKKGEGPIVIGSFSFELLKEVRKLIPHFPIVAFTNKMEDIERFCSLKPRYLALCDSLITPELVEHAKERNIQIWAWMVDELDKANALANMGVNGVITDTPYAMHQGRL